MPRTQPDVPEVAPYVTGPICTSAEHGEGRELRWANSDFHSGVQVYGQGVMTVIRPGKGGRLSFDALAVRSGMTEVRYHDSGGDRVVAWLGAPLDGPVQVTEPDAWPPRDRSCSSCGCTCKDTQSWTEYPNIETAVADLAFLHLS